MTAALQRIAIKEGETSALEVGGRLLEFTLNDALVGELIKLADSNGQASRADEWRTLQEKARLAREEMSRIEAISQL